MREYGAIKGYNSSPRVPSLSLYLFLKFFGSRDGAEKYIGLFFSPSKNPNIIHHVGKHISKLPQAPYVIILLQIHIY